MYNNPRLKGELLKLIFKGGKSGDSRQTKKLRSFGKKIIENQQTAWKWTRNLKYVWYRLKQKQDFI